MQLQKTLDSLFQKDDVQDYTVTVYLKNGNSFWVKSYYNPQSKSPRDVKFFDAHPEFKFDDSSYVIEMSTADPSKFIVLNDDNVSYFEVDYEHNRINF